MNSLDLNDLPFLKEESLRVFHWLLAEYPKVGVQKSSKEESSNVHSKENLETQSEDQLETIELPTFPIRWKTEQMGKIFEWVVSDMGSVTLRLGGLEGNRRNPSPIFYLSLRKTDEGKFFWTDPEGNPILFPDPSIRKEIQNRIQLYVDSVS
ncbi:LIC_13241 domain-containing protein [Leptospira terpstrae]|uniref:Uncharacterized protein n=1 Tax=Leptospira terpstrae serovar Hualin str. LT 11-33 = ATCC 700639 TaxID=1257025 RepID=N1W6V0_9LEPT|nr:hypothetical protein [Leptospira terpstrae]EMY63386.1 hypothetical protein LEP1GSC203_2656 [Leptospira terpstrae serovar Hualin str. LT 11-33 = ATCC 700639]